jgi:hypothetical protein
MSAPHSVVVATTRIQCPRNQRTACASSRNTAGGRRTLRWIQKPMNTTSTIQLSAGWCVKAPPYTARITHASG